MLYYATQPDLVFLAIVESALVGAGTWVEDPACWRRLAHHVAEGYPRHEAPRTELTRLHRAHRSPTIQRMSTLYWVLLHDCLAAYVSDHNGRLRPGRALGTLGLSAVGPFQVGMIDLPTIVATYYWDLTCFPESAADRSLAPPPIAHRVRGGPERYAPPASGFAPIGQPRWARNPDAGEFINPAIGILRYPLFTAPAVLDAW